MGYVFSLENAAEFADLIEETSAASSYRSYASTIKDTLSSHWNGNFLWESDNR